MPYMEATLITLAAGAASSSGAVSRHMSSTLIRLTSMTWRRSSRDCSSIGPSSQIPALLTSTSRRPCDSSRPASACRWRASVMSPAIVSIRSPHSRASSSSRSARRAVASTCAPAWCSTRANRAPRPAEAPVTSATRPSRRHGSPPPAGAAIRRGPLIRTPGVPGRVNPASTAQLREAHYAPHQGSQASTRRPAHAHPPAQAGRDTTARSTRIPAVRPGVTGVRRCGLRWAQTRVICARLLALRGLGLLRAGRRRG